MCFITFSVRPWVLRFSAPAFQYLFKIILEALETGVVAALITRRTTDGSYGRNEIRARPECYMLTRRFDAMVFFLLRHNAA